MREHVLAALDHKAHPKVPWVLEIDIPGPVNADLYERLFMESSIKHVRVLRNMDLLLTDNVVSIDRYGTAWRVNAKPMKVIRPALSKPTLDGFKWPAPIEFLDSGYQNAQEFYHGGRDLWYIVHDLTWGLWETFASLRGCQQALEDVILEEDFFEEVLDKLVDQFFGYIDIVLEALPGIEGFLFGDDWGDQRGVILGPERWRKHLKPRWAKIYAYVHSKGLKTMSHSCGSLVDIMDDIIEIGLDVLESCQPEARGMNPYELKRRWGDKIVFWGCLGSQWPLGTGTPADIHREVAQLREGMSQDGGFILAPSKPVQAGMPVENVNALVNAFLGG